MLEIDSRRPQCLSPCAEVVARRLVKPPVPFNIVLGGEVVAFAAHPAKLRENSFRPEFVLRYHSSDTDARVLQRCVPGSKMLARRGVKILSFLLDDFS